MILWQISKIKKFSNQVEELEESDADTSEGGDDDDTDESSEWSTEDEDDYSVDEINSRMSVSNLQTLSLTLPASCILQYIRLSPVFR